MRGVFNDFASEVNRSIGFYSSINRQAKIKKVVGLGNGFKLPGLQKFLQQNLNQEIERLETFEKLVGDEVKGAPQFQDNLASFAVAYGLGVQGLNRGGLSTNLLPPEIERIRLIRAKKPWTLAAAALIMLGLTFLFTLGDYRVLATVTTIPFQDAVKRAKTVSKRGGDIQTAFDTAAKAWKDKNEEGNALIIDPTDRARWPQFFATISGFFPDPEQEYQLDPADPKSVDTLEMLRVHIDAIKPVYRKDVAEWFTALDPKFKMLMHPVDAETPPSGEGWIIQLICHHYNPYPRTRDQHAFAPTDPRRTDFGPVEFLMDKVLPKLNSPNLRIYGVHHVAVAWMTSEKEWTSEKGQSSNNLASNTIPLLDRASAPVASEGGASGGAGAGGPAGGMEAMMKGSMTGFRHDATDEPRHGRHGRHGHAGDGWHVWHGRCPGRSEEANEDPDAHRLPDSIRLAVQGG
jgi:type IV pilus assembly protein PilM